MFFGETKILVNFKNLNKMKNLKNLKVVELNALEVKKVEGGFIREMIKEGFLYFLSNPRSASGINAHTYYYGHVGGARP